MSSMLPMLRRQFSSTLAVFLMLVALPAAARAEDGYDLWLRYAPIESAPLRDAYRQAIAGLVVQQTPATGAIVTKEVTRALKGLIGVDVPAWTGVTGDGALVIGTASSPIVSALGWGDVLKGLGPEGYVIRGTRIGGKRAIVVASAGDSGALYGTFHLLRLLSDGDADPAARRARQAAPPAPHPQPLGQPRRLDRARLRRPLAVEVGRAAGDDRSAAARLRARQRLDRPERHRHQQRQRQPAGR